MKSPVNQLQDWNLGSRKKVNMLQECKGTGVAIVTPFDQESRVDYESLGKLVEYIISNKVEFIVALGTTSEAATLNASEKLEVMRFVKGLNGNRIPLVMGIGGNDTAKVVKEIREADYEGVSAVLSVAPYYNKPNQRGLHQHFSAIATVCPVDIILYNVPGRTSSNIAAATVIELAKEHANIVAVKEASGDLDQISEIIKNKPEGFSVLSGDDALTYPLMALGADGVISVVANAFPGPFSKMVRLTLENNFEEARKIHYSLLEIITYLFADGNPAGVKAALTALNICQNHLRLPMVPADERVQEQLKRLVSEYKSPV
jgi:4-hydroxy-tetrahydrodipicolinate synthase